MTPTPGGFEPRGERTPGDAGPAVKRVRIVSPRRDARRRSEKRPDAVELTEPDPALANALYPYLDSPAAGELLESWHGRYVD